MAIIPRDSTDLSVHRTFVVQLHAGAIDGRYSGRVEHVVSGRTAQFTCLDALLDFMRHAGAVNADENAAGDSTDA